MNPLESLQNKIHASIDAKQAFLRCDHSLQLFERCVVTILDSYQSGGRLYIAGNGGFGSGRAAFGCRVCKQASA